MKIEDIKYSGNPFKRRNRIEEAVGHLPQLRKVSEETPTPAEPKKETKRPKIYKAVLLGVVLLAAVFALYIYAHRAPDILGEVGKLTSLPAGETPTIATVTDLVPLKGEAFFADAKLGDKVIVYSVAKRAILYRPSTGKVIIVAPIK